MAHIKAAYSYDMEMFRTSPHRYSLYAFYVVEQLAGLDISGYGIFAGIQLWKKNKSGIEAAKRFMVASVIYHALDLLMGINWAVLMGHVSLLRSISWKVVRPLLNAIAYGLLWYSYLLKSNRVLITFWQGALAESSRMAKDHN